MQAFTTYCQWRNARQSDELAYCTIDGRGREGKGVTWKKFDLKISAIAMYLKNKVKIVAGDSLLLMYTHSEEFVYAVHACMVLGVTAIPMAPLDSNRMNEDSPALLSMISDFKIKAILVNNDVDQLLKSKSVNQHLRQTAMISKVAIPNTYKYYQTIKTITWLPRARIHHQASLGSEKLCSHYLGLLDPGSATCCCAAGPSYTDGSVQGSKGDLSNDEYSARLSMRQKLCGIGFHSHVPYGHIPCITYLSGLTC